MSERACGEALEETLGPSLERWTCVEEHREETALQLKRAGLDASGACGMKHSCGVDGTKRVKGAEAACRFGVVRKDAVVQGPVHVPTYVSALSRAAPHVPRVPHGPQLGGELAREGRHMVDQRAAESIHQGRFVQLAREPVKRHRRRRCRLGFMLFGTLRLRLHGKRLADHCQRPEDGIHELKGKHADRNDLHDPAGSCSLWVRRANECVQHDADESLVGL